MSLIIDDREALEAQEHRGTDVRIAFGRMNIPAVVERLEAADYAFPDRDGEPTGVERCEIGNLIQKLRNGELETQLARCDDYYSRVILLTEGVYDHVQGFLAHYKRGRNGNVYYRTRIEPNMFFKEVEAFEIRVSELGIETIWSPDFDFTMDIIGTLYSQRTKPEEEHSLFKKTRKVNIPLRLTSNPSVPMLMSICPKLPEKTAIRLIHRFDSIWNILNASPQELLEVEGFGKGLMMNLYRGVGKS